eukprot:1159632-Pelagomonas_calceolata.AAC.2
MTRVLSDGNVNVPFILCVATLGLANCAAAPGFPTSIAHDCDSQCEHSPHVLMTTSPARALALQRSSCTFVDMPFPCKACHA